MRYPALRALRSRFPRREDPERAASSGPHRGRSETLPASEVEVDAGDSLVREAKEPEPPPVPTQKLHEPVD